MRLFRCRRVRPRGRDGFYPDVGITIGGRRDRPPELVLPLGETVRVDVTSLDVDHSFWIPAFPFKRDAIPGLRNTVDLASNKVGVFRGRCGERCGLERAQIRSASASCARTISRPARTNATATRSGSRSCDEPTPSPARDDERIGAPRRSEER